MPSWKYTLNYETKWMTREELVKATYEAALRLLGHKERYGVIGKEKAAVVRDHTERAIKLVDRISEVGNTDEAVMQEIFRLNTFDSLCDKHELDWPIRGWKVNIMGIARLLFMTSGKGAGSSAK